MKRKPIFTVLITILLLLGVAPDLALASYKVTPKIIDEEVMPRDIFTETITIKNDLHHKVDIYASVNEVAMDEGGDVTAFVPRSVADNKITPTSWIAITRSRISIAPGKSKDVEVHFKIHPEAEPGVYHVLLGFGSGHNKPIADKKVKDGLAPTVIVTMKVDQNQTEFLKLGKFIVDRFVTKEDNQAITYTLSNPGTAVVVPRGEIIFSDARGNEVAAVPVNPDQVSLTPGQETVYTIAAPTEDMMGKYKAFLNIDYGSANLASVYDTTFFYVLPLRQLLIIFVIVLVAAILATLLLHRRYSGDSGYDDGSDEIPVFIRDGSSAEKEHDINLK